MNSEVSARSRTESSFEAVLAELEETLKWLEQVGARIPGGSRFLAYRDRIRELQAHLTTSEQHPDGETVNRWYSALFEARELESLRVGLARLEDVRALPKILAVVMAGPPDIADEAKTEGAHKARDTAFELHLASRLRLAGYHPDLNQRGDAVFALDDQRVVAECKRPRSPNAVLVSLVKARQQALNDVGVQGSGLSSGLLAVDLSYVIAPHGLLLRPEGPPEETLAKLKESIAAAINSNMQNLWHPRILGVLFRFAFLVEANGIPNYLQEWGMIVNREPDCDERRSGLATRLGQDLANALQEIG